MYLLLSSTDSTGCSPPSANARGTVFCTRHPLRTFGQVLRARPSVVRSLAGRTPQIGKNATHDVRNDMRARMSSVSGLLSQAMAWKCEVQLHNG